MGDVGVNRIEHMQRRRAGRPLDGRDDCGGQLRLECVCLQNAKSCAARSSAVA